MAVLNYTPFPALRFDNIDQHGQLFEVLALRQTLSFASGVLDYADEQAPLSESDTFFGTPNASSMQQESDLCAFKPKCDVIVNATAHAPGGRPTRRFYARLAVRLPDAAAPTPLRPQGLNQLMEPNPTDLARWKLDMAQAERTRVPGRSLIDKIVVVHGQRQFKKKRWLTRTVGWAMYCASLTLIRPSAWKLGKAQPFTSLPLRYEYAYGGQYRVQHGEPAAHRIPFKHRLTPEQRDAGPDLDAAAELQAIAHTAFDANPVGQGYAVGWALKANRTSSFPAPRIESLGNAVSAKQFSRWLAMPASGSPEFVDRVALHQLAGFGIRSKTHPQRSALLGTVDAAFVQSRAPLPQDFDNAYWSAAPPDQQIDFPNGDETIDLVNLCSHATAGASITSTGDTFLRLHLLRHQCFVLRTGLDGRSVELPMHIDTVIVAPEECTVTLVWRVTLAKSVAEADYEIRLRTHAERDLAAADNATGTTSKQVAAKSGMR